MLDKILNLSQEKNSVNEFLSSVRQGKPSAAFGVPESFKPFIISSFSSPVLCVVSDGISAEKLKKATLDLTNGKKTVEIIPPSDLTLILTKAFSREIAHKRVSAISKISSTDVLILTVPALAQKYPKKVYTLTICRGDDFGRETLIENLVKMGYSRQENAECKGTFSVRGDAVDVFNIADETPTRIDFFGDTVDNVKKIDAETRKNLGQLSEVKIVQASEYVLTESIKNQSKEILNNEVKNCSNKSKKRLIEVMNDVLESVSLGDNDSAEFLSGAFGLGCEIFDLISQDTVVIFDEPKKCYTNAGFVESEFNTRFERLYNEGEVFGFSKDSLISIDRIKDRLKKFKVGAISTMLTDVGFFNPLSIIHPNVSAVSDYHMNFSEVYTDIKNWVYNGYDVLILTGELKRSDRFSYDLLDNGINSIIGRNYDMKGVVVSDETLDKGFVFHEQKIAVVGSGNLFVKSNKSLSSVRRKNTFFNAPETGDYCVHEVHGVGRVLGNKKITTSEGTKDYVAVEYSGKDVLYVPVEQMDILTRYLGKEKHPKLSKIGGKDFERVKNSVRESIKKMSFDLKKLYSERRETKGYKFSEQTELYQAFVNYFPFEETPDQANAEAEILDDMTSDRVMDRLVCGDVGFGKTEVAFRAIFTAIANGKQAALLAPTTILTEQHFTTAKERFREFGIKIACLNRFRTAREQTQIINALKEGKIDLIIGTHRLLSRDVNFADLGILVLDEEQRFGVEHKERIKLLKKNVDTLTLTATPIPRTLHMSLTGIRSISTINTPPKKRLPVQTFVTEETDGLIKDAILREVNRGGQVFILYNRVESIEKFNERIKTLLPDLKTIVSHGQMDERTLEKNIMRFYNGEANVLISTTIIENGIDLPNANTLIVIDADNLGLSTLYQLKGRVGRSDRLAYAYFTFKRDKILSQTAYERLNAITDFTEMGSGIKIAMRDLEIRGAGNVLGAEQHGHMDKVGYELYSKLLKEELTGEHETIPELDVRLNAFVSEKYIESNSGRMDVYKQIAEINSKKAEKEIYEYLTDTYGIVPRETVNLINIACAKFYASKVGVSKITVTADETSLEFESIKSFSNSKLVDAIESFSGGLIVAMNVLPKLRFKREGRMSFEMLEIIKAFLEKVI